MSGQDWKVGDQVMHPRRLEWGMGTVQPGSLAPKFKIIFATAGLKTIDTSLVPLRAFQIQIDQKAKGGESRKSRLKPVSTPREARLFHKEWSFEYISAWKKFWKEGGQVHEWAEQYPLIFMEKDRLAAFEADGRGKASQFLPWMASILVWESFHLPSQMAWARPHLEKRRAQLMGPKAEAFENLLKEHAWQNFPQLLVFLEDFSKCTAVYLSEDQQKITKEKAAAILALKKIGIEVDWIRVKPEHFVHILAGHTPA